ATEVHAAIAPFAHVATLRGLAQDEEEIGELLVDPRPGVVLVADRVDAQLLQERIELLRCALLANSPEGLSQLRRTSPDDNVQRSLVAAIDGRDDPLRAFGVLVVAETFDPANRIAGFDAFEQV